MKVVLFQDEVCSPCVWASTRYASFLPQSKDRQVRRNTKLVHDMKACMGLFVCVCQSCDGLATCLG